ncbi:MAG TPA: MBL fold metallo-hydrolase [Candidatus Binataceae bacterium]|nr:MBL fold metallo-hydrolase [Candidatus Binataceae bacterium]
MILAWLSNFMARNSTNGRNDSGAESMSLTLLGTGDAFASGGRAQAGYLLEAARKKILFEAGPGLMTELKRRDIKADTLDAVVISHLHGDHFGGLPFLFLEYMWESPRKRPITIAGPEHLEQRTWTLMKTMFARFKLADLQAKVKWVVLEPGKSVRVAGLRLSSIRSPHTTPDVSLSVKIVADGKTFVFSGDSGWNDELLDFCAGADLLLCECTYFESDHLRFHMNYPELARNRERFKVKRMILTHLGREALNHAAEMDIEMGFDGMKLEI